MRSLSLLGGVVLFLAAGCESDDGGGGGGPGAVASGVAVKGPVADADVTVLELRATGAFGATRGSGTTDATGEFDVAVSGPAGLAVACVTGGTYVDEATGASLSIPVDEPLYGFVDVQPVALRFAVTPLTTIAVELLPSLAHDPEGTLFDDVDNALAVVEGHFGLTDLDSVVPADLAAGPVVPGAEADHGAVLAGLSRLASDLGVDPMELVGALALDARDGVLDGLEFEFDVPLGAGVLPADAGTGGLAAAIAAFLASPENASGLTDADTTVDDTLAASTGVLAKPLQVRALANGYGLVAEAVAAELQLAEVPPSPQVLIETQLLTITSQTATTLGFDIPAGLPLGFHDLVVRDGDTGLVTRLRDAVEVFDPGAAPTVTSIEPATGPLTGGTLLEIRGTNFGPGEVVTLDGVAAQVVTADLPRKLVVATPPHAAGTVDVAIGPVIEVVVPDAFEYRDGDVRANAALPAPTAPLVYGAFRMSVDAVDGVTAEALVGRATFANEDSGDFDLTAWSTNAAVPAVALRQASGQSFQSVESLGKALLLFDTQALTSDFLRGSTNEANGISLGATAFGPACFFPEPTDALPATVAKTYWVNGIEADLAAGRVRQRTGWLELDEELIGSANFLVHEQELDGTSATVGAETWTLDCTLTQEGRLQGFREEGGVPQAIRGHFSAGAELGFLLEDRPEGSVSFYWLTPIEHGLENAAWGGWVGGFVAHDDTDDGLGGTTAALDSGTYRGLVAGTALDCSRLAFERRTRVTSLDPEGVFEERVGAAALDVSPSGRMFDEDGDLVGYVGGAGLLLALGRFPNECALLPRPELAIGGGGAVFRHSRKSYLSVQPVVKQIAITARFAESGATHAQELGTDFVDLTLDTTVQPSVSGVTIPLAGTIPELAAAALTGLHKSTERDEAGVVTTVRSAPPPWGVTMGFAFVDDELDLFATEVTEPGGRFGGASVPRWVANGALGNDGEVATLRSSDEFLGDALLWLVAKGEGFVLPTLEMQAVSLALEPDLAGETGVTSTHTEFQFAGNGTVAGAALSQTMSEAGVFTTDTSAGLGTNTAPSGQELRTTLEQPVGTVEWQTFWTRSGDAFFGIDDTPNLDRAEIVLAVVPEIGGSFVDDDHVILGIELDPQASRATTQRVFLHPRTGSILSGELFTSRRDADGHARLPGQLFAGTDPTDLGNGEARVPFLGQIPVLRFLFNGREESIGQQELTLLVTPRILQAIDD